MVTSPIISLDVVLIWIDSRQLPCFHGSKFHLREIHRYPRSFLMNMERNESKWLSRNINNNWLLMIDKEEFKDRSFSVTCKNVISLKITIIVNQSI